MKTKLPHPQSMLLHRGALAKLPLWLAALCVFGTSLSQSHAARVDDPADLPDSSGDIRSIEARVIGGFLHLSMTAEGVAAPSIEQTPSGKVNRYYYHWMLDTDNDPATGSFFNDLYEGANTGVAVPIGAELFVQIGWRDGKPNGIAVYDPADDDNPVLVDFSYQASGNTLTAMIPLEALGLVQGQTIAVSAFQEGASDGWLVDWMEPLTLTLSGPQVPAISVDDPQDLPDSSGDIRTIGAYVIGENLHLWMTVQGVAAPSIAQTPAGKSNRYYYHWMLDTDNDPATGSFFNDLYEGQATGVSTPIGAELFVQVGWRDGKPNGIAVYDPADDDNPIVTGFTYQGSGNTLTAVLPLSALGLVPGQTVALAAFQEGASDGWLVDWTESQPLTLTGPAAALASVNDSQDLPDSSGDIRSIRGWVMGDNLHLSMTVEGVATPSVEQTPVGKVNRYYYHWMLDTDNDPATGSFFNDIYEGQATGVATPIGAELFVQVGWRDGKPNGIAAYDPADDDNPVVTGFSYQGSGNTVTAVIPLAALGLVPGQTIAISAFQEGASDGWLVDWMESAALNLKAVSSSQAPVVGVDDPQDLPDSSGDIKRIEATLDNGDLVLRMSVYGKILPSIEETPAGKVNRYYYHWMLDIDNDPATGSFFNDIYEGQSTGVTPIGVELFVQIGWRNGAPNGIAVYDPADDDNPLVVDFPFTAADDTVEARIPLSALGLAPGQTLAFSAFQEGASDGWLVDWLEAGVITLSENTGISLNTRFRGNAYDFQIDVTDSEGVSADPETVQVSVNGQTATVTAIKTGGVTVIAGLNPSLLPSGVHHLTLSLDVDGARESQEYPLVIGPYTVLPVQGRLTSIDTANTGFLVNSTLISSLQSGVTSLHEDIAELAEKQLAGEFFNEGTQFEYYNEADQDFEFFWNITPFVNEGVINWFGNAPDDPATDRFPDDAGIPNVSNFAGTQEGLVIEILTYLELEAGFYKIGLHTEGGYKANAGLIPAGPVLGLFDDSGGVNDRIPVYYAKTQSFDIVAPGPGYYPIRILWFQSRRNQESAPLLEILSSSREGVHLLNNPDDTNSILAYRAGILLTPGAEFPTLQISVSDGSMVVTFTGTLEAANELGGEWTEIGTAGDSPLTLNNDRPTRFLRAKTVAE